MLRLVHDPEMHFLTVRVHRVSWDDWEDRQSGVAGYAYQIVGVSDLSGRGKATVFTNASATVRMTQRLKVPVVNCTQCCSMLW